MSNIYISKFAPDILKDYIKEKGHKIVEVFPNKNVHPSISCHPDLFMCKLGNEAFSELFMGTNSELNNLGMVYPSDVSFNAIVVGKYFIHNLKYTSTRLLSRAKDMELTFINVSQGYTKCNTVIVDSNHIITSDAGISKALKSKTDIKVLDILPGFVELPPFKYGFLGGTSGRVGNEIIFNGNLKNHQNYIEISKFISSTNIEVKFFEEYPLFDIGSFFEASCQNFYKFKRK